MNWERVNVWTTTLYMLIQALELARQQEFGDLSEISANIKSAGEWISPGCSYASVLIAEPFGKHGVTFRRNPNTHFKSSCHQFVKMLVQDLTTIIDEMASEALDSLNESAGRFPQSKIERLATHIAPQYRWATNGCLELIAARNVLTHNGGIWNKKSLGIVKPFLGDKSPKEGDVLVVGFSMLFRYRKAMRTFLNELPKCPLAGNAKPTKAPRATTKGQRKS